MIKTLSIVLLLYFLLGTAEAGQVVLAVQSVSIPPYEQAIKGFEHIYRSEVRRLLISGLKEKEIRKAIYEVKPDLILAVGRDALLGVRKIKHLPILYLMVLNPQSVLAGEKNISGVSMNLSPEKQLLKLVKVIPSTKSIRLLYDPRQTGFFVREAEDAAKQMGVKLISAAVYRSRDVPSLLKNMTGKADVFWMLPDITILTPETIEAIILYSLENKMPVLTFSEKYLELGAMLSIGIDPYDIGSQAGEMAQKIFTGTDIRDIREVDARKAIMSVNLKIAGKLGIDVDQKAIRNDRIFR